jgi:hypothetical protein
MRSAKALLNKNEFVNQEWNPDGKGLFPHLMSKTCASKMIGVAVLKMI